MELFYFKEKEELNDFIKSQAGSAGAEFLQSWQWGEVVRPENAEILRVGVRSAEGKTGPGKILAAATLIKRPLALFGSKNFYWYAPRGPLGEKKVLEFLLGEIKKIDSKAIFLRFEAPEIISGVRRTKDYQPSKTMILDLRKDEDKLLGEMSQKTRYNIRLAEKKGVEICVGSATDWPEFWRLLNLTGERDGFRLHDEKHYKNLLAVATTGGSVLSGSVLPGTTDAEKGGEIRLFFARYKGKNIAAALFSFWGGRASYLHGASDNDYRNVMAPHFLQWTAIKAARIAGCRAYDFCGIDEKKWPGVTRFKRGFGGQVLEFPGTFDAVFRPFAYRIYNLLRKVRRLI